MKANWVYFPCKWECDLVPWLILHFEKNLLFTITVKKIILPKALTLSPNGRIVLLKISLSQMVREDYYSISIVNYYFLHLFIWVSMHIWFICLSMHIWFICLSITLFVYQFICLYIYCLSIYLFLYLSIYLSVFVSIYLSI